jgi:adenylosuccinate synthase
MVLCCTFHRISRVGHFYVDCCGLFVKTKKKELKNLENQGIDYKGRILISDRAHVLFDFHQAIDGAAEDAAALTGQKIGTTRRGIGPAYASKVDSILDVWFVWFFF